MERDVDQVSKNWPNVVVGRPSGCCAGVERAILAYQELIDSNPTETVYSVGEPAHNPVIIDKFKKQGVRFVQDISQVPEEATVAFGPHGHTDEDVATAKAQRNTFILTECPLVTSVKTEVAANIANGITTIYYGQIDKRTGQPHPEARAVLSIAKNPGEIIFVTSLEEALAVEIKDLDKVGFTCQTTHNVDEVMEMAEKLREKYPSLKMRDKSGLCFATRNRQLVVETMDVDATIIIGDMATSANTNSLVNVAMGRSLKEKKHRVFSGNEVREFDNPRNFEDLQTVGIIGSASASPEQIEEVVKYFTDRGSEELPPVVVAEENYHFPPVLVYKPD
jgi:4-hydroxy-3-methylbut-2-en-1-yl diphosphate reductase